MRLTLRTLLAYLDDVLDPADAAELAKKIEDSDFAKSLVQRIRSASGRTRLGAPGIDGKGVGLDANTVAEYLDNVLPPDRIPDLERICLESDVHLAEVASCHQILTIVLGEAAEIDGSLRDRIYSIVASDSERRGTAPTPGEASMSPPPVGQQAAAASPPAPPMQLEPPPVPAVPPSGEAVTLAQRGRAQKVPDYLRAGQRSRWKPLAITLLLAFLVSAVALRAMGPFDADHPLLRLMSGGESSQVAAVAPAPEVEAEEEEATGNGGGEAAGTASGAGAAQGDAADVVRPAVDSPAGDAPAAGGDRASSTPTGEPESPASEADTSIAAVADARNVTEPLRAEASGVSQPVPAPPAPSAPPAPGQTALDPAVEATADGFPDTEPVFPDEPAVAPAATGMEEGPGAVAPAGVEPPMAVEVGYVKIQDLHFPLRLDLQTRDWYRLPPRSKLMSGDSLRVLPTFRPEIVLAPGVQVVFAGPSSVHMTAPTPEGQPTLLVEYGRAFIATAGVPGAQLHLNLDGRSSVVTFVEAASELALEVRRFLPPGADPEQQTTQRVVRVFATIGQIEWQDDESAPPVPLVEGQVRVLVDDNAETVAVGAPPAWILRDDVRDIDRDASMILEDHLVAERPVTLSLRELMQDRRTEIRSLAARCLSHLGFHEPLAEEFNDLRQKGHWAVEFETLRSALARSPDSAASLRQALRARYAAVADDAYRLLAGYSPQQLQEGGDVALVGFLDHETLCLRVLAFENLRRITGQTGAYLAYVTDERRKSSVRGWRERLEQGEILYQSFPTPTSEGW